MPGFYETLGSKPETEKLEAPVRGFYATLEKGKKVGAKALKVGADIIGPPTEFLGSVAEYPVAAALSYGLGTGIPPKFSPTAGIEQFRTPQGQALLRNIAGPLPPPSPEVADIGASLLIGGGLNVLGAKAILPTARAIGNIPGLRQAPIIKQAIEFVKTGSSLPKQYRQGVQDILRTAEGQADLSQYLRDKLYRPVLKLPEAQQQALRRAIEVGDLSTLPPSGQKLAQSLIDDWASNVQERVAAEVRPFERRPGMAYAGGRVATEKALGEMQAGRPRRFSTAPRGLSTGKMGKIAEENLPLTTEEVAAKVSAAVPKLKPDEVFEPIGKAGLASGAKHDVRLMHARIVKQLVEKYGQPAARPYESVAALHEGVKTGFNESFQRVLERTSLPGPINELVGNLNKRMQPEEFGRIQRAMRWVNTGFKKWALFTPRYTSRNLQNNLFQIAVFEDLGPKEMFQLRKALAPDEALRREAIGLGVIGRGQTAQEITSAGAAPFRLARKVNTSVEDASRLWLYLIRRGKGDTPAQAASRVDDILFNYSPRLASRARRYAGQNVVPFVNWTTFIPGLTARAVLERPGSVAILGAAAGRAKEKYGYDEERLAKEFGPWNVPQGVTPTGPGKAIIPGFAGQYSVNELVPNSVEDAANKFLQKIYPTMGVPAQLGMGREAFTGRQFFEHGKERFAAAPGSLRALWAIPGFDKFAQAHGISIDPDTKKVIAPARLALVLQSFPQSRITDFVSDWLAGVGREQKSSFLPIRQATASFGLGIREVQKYEPKKK